MSEATSPEQSAAAAIAAVQHGEVSAQALSALFLERVEQHNPELGAIRHVNPGVMDAAGAIDDLVRSGVPMPPLAGLPIVVKENCDTAGLFCSAGLPFRKDHVPQTDSAITARLRAAGAIIIGTSVSDPGAFGVRTAEVSHPVDPTLTVGGSSGGSAAALAANFCLGAIGTDTGGSIRIPSACCGTVGLKPTFGTLPMEGVFPLVPSLDHVGPMASSVDDARLLWRAISHKVVNTRITPQRVGYDPRWVEIADRPIRTAFHLGLERLNQSGIATQEVELPDLDDVVRMHGDIFLVEAAAWHCANNGGDLADYPDLAREWFALAQDMKVRPYIEACEKRVAMTYAIDRLLQDVDAIVTPTICVARPSKAARTLVIDTQDHDYVMALVRLTCLFDHTGHPAVSVPVGGADDTLASSMQVAGRRNGEENILDIASILEADRCA